jgi:hypothetical protein
MKDRTVPQLHAVLDKYIKKWKRYLFLNTWLLDSSIRDYIQNDRDNIDTIATCDAEWKYFHVTLNFSYAKMRDMKKTEIEKIVIHELLHAVVNEMR